MTLRRVRSLSLIAAVLVFLGAAHAADTNATANPQLMLVTSVKVKPEMAKQWEEVQGQISNASQKAGVPFRAVWQTTMFGELSTYATVSAISKFADLDEESPYVKMVPKEQRDKNAEVLRQSSGDVHRIVLRTRPDLSIGQLNSLPSTPMEMVRLTVAPGRNVEFENLLKTEWNPAAKKGGAEVAIVHQVLMGARTPEYHILVGINKYADFDSPSPVMKALGKAAADKLMAKFAGIILEINTSIIRVRPEISYMMKSEKAAAAGE